MITVIIITVAGIVAYLVAGLAAGRSCANRRRREERWGRVRYVNGVRRQDPDTIDPDDQVAVALAAIFWWGYLPIAFMTAPPPASTAKQIADLEKELGLK